jgi:hypothetical protein
LCGGPTSHNRFTIEKEGDLPMKKLIVRYVRYLLALLANVGFGRNLN